MNIGKFLSGVVVLTFGILLLLLNFGLVNASDIYDFFKFWPVILIVIGLSIIFKILPRPIEVLFNIILSLAIIAGLIFVITEATYRKSEVSSSQASNRQEIAEPVNEEARKAKIEIDAGAGEIDVAGGSTLLIEGRVENIFGTTSLSRSLQSEGRIDQIKISQFSKNWIRSWSKDRKNNWDLKINRDLETALEINSGASKIDVSLLETNVNDLSIDAGASTIDIDLASLAQELRTQLTAGASTINIKAPKDTGLKILLNAGLTTNNFEKQGLSKLEQTYSTDNYGQATRKAELVIDAGASTINLDRY